MTTRNILRAAMMLAMLLTATSSRGDAVSLWNVLQYQLTNASQDAEAPTVITLDCDYVAGSNDGRLEVPNGRHAIIDLNGHTIDRHLSEAKNEGNVIYVKSSSSLVIRDSQGGGQITGGYVTNGSGGGIFANGSVTLEGGTICGNSSNNHAGGVFVGGTFTMTGGTITDNTCTASGSAIYTNGATINISGGTITGNYGKNAIYVTGAGGHLNLSGSYDVSGNFLSLPSEGSGETPPAAIDITLSYPIIKLTAAISPAHPATVSVDGGGSLEVITSGWSTYMNTKRPSDYFVARAYDIANGKIVGLLDDELVLSTPEAIYWHADSDHDGTSKEKAYIITNAWGLEYLATYVNSGNEAYGMYFKLGADIDMSGINHFTPIGFCSDKVFRGYFDGQDYTISGLTINQPNDSYVGLFGYVVNGAVQNVILSDANISGHNYVGGIVGYITNSTIQNCFVINSSISSETLAGAIMGTYNNLINFRYNYYHNCKVTKHSTEYTSDIGTNNGDVSTSSNIHGAKAVLALADNADNSSVIANENGNTIGVYLEGRTLYRDGDWNTLCLPFQVSLSNSPLAGAEAREFTGSSFDSATGTLNLTFSEPVTSIYPGKPYIIRWAAAATNIVNPLFRRVGINKLTYNTETDYVDFVSTYDPIVWETENKSILFLGANNTLYWPKPEGDNKPYINACRAYFKLKGLEASPNPSQGGGHAVREFVMSFDDEDTGIRPTPNPSQNGGEWYNLQGRKLAGKPTQKGLYIYNGIKVAIK